MPNLGLQPDAQAGRYLRKLRFESVRAARRVLISLAFRTGNPVSRMQPNHAFQKKVDRHLARQEERGQEIAGDRTVHEII